MRDIKFKMNKPQKGNKQLKLHIGGNLGVGNLAELTEKLIDIEKEFSEFEVNLNDVTIFDLATIQMLLALKKTCEKHQKEIKFKIDLSKETAELVENTGFSSIIRKL